MPLLPITYTGYPGNSYFIEMLFGLAVGVCAIAAHRYTVTVESDGVTIGAFRKRHFLISEVTKIEVVTGKGNSKTAIVTLSSGKSVQMIGFPTDFRELVDDLNRRAGVTPI